MKVPVFSKYIYAQKKYIPENIKVLPWNKMDHAINKLELKF